MNYELVKPDVKDSSGKKFTNLSDCFSIFFNFFENNIHYECKCIDDIITIPVIGYNFDIKNERFKSEPATVNKKIFELLYDEFTYGLLKHIPKKYDNYVHTGGSLHDILTHNFISLLRLKETDVPHFAHNIIKEYVDENIDIDIFMYGSNNNNKLNLVLDFINSLHKKYLVSVDVDGCIVNIFIEGIPRTIQFVFTKEEKPFDIILNFDSTYIMLYYHQQTLFINQMCIMALETRTSIWCKRKTINYIKRLYKQINRNYKLGIAHKLIISPSNFYLCDEINYKKLKKEIEERKPKVRHLLCLPKNSDDLGKFFSDLYTSEENHFYRIDNTDDYNTHEIFAVKELYKKLRDIQMLDINSMNNYGFSNEKCVMYNSKTGLTNDNDYIHSYENDSKIICINRHYTVYYEPRDRDVLGLRSYIYNVDLDQHNLIFTNCRCISVYYNPLSVYKIAKIQIDPNSKVYNYIKFLLNRINNNCVKYNFMHITDMHSRVKHIVNSCNMDENENNVIEIHMPRAFKMRKNRTYPIIIAKPRLFVKGAFATFYWRRIDCYYGVYNKKDDSHWHIYEIMLTIKTKKMKKLRTKFIEIMKWLNLKNPQASV